MSCEKIKLVTSVNGETGDVVIKFPDTSYFYTKTEIDNIVENAVKVKSVNGQTGDVVIEVPNNLSQLNNDMDYITRSETVDINTYNQHVENQSVENTNFSNNITDLQNNKADKTEIPDVSIYNPTDNFKTINGESIIGTGNIDIQVGSAVTSVNGQTGDVTIDIPTNVSQLNNDAGYLTEHQDLSNYATKTELSEYNKTENFKTINSQSIIGTGNIEIQVSSDVTSVNGQTGDVTIDIPTNVSQLNNDAGYITDSALADYARTENTVNINTYNQFVENQTAKNQELNDKIGYIDTSLLNILGDE